MDIKEQVAATILGCVKANEKVIGIGLSETSAATLADHIHSLYQSYYISLFLEISKEWWDKIWSGQALQGGEKSDGD